MCSDENQPILRESESVSIIIAIFETTKTNGSVL